ncbi:MAG: hypothetical protein RLZZ275_126, partial [Bacteroidota bacterium]
MVLKFKKMLRRSTRSAALASAAWALASG